MMNKPPADGFTYDPEVGPDWWTMAPTRLLRARGLSPTAKLLYLVLCSYAMQKTEAWPGQERLAADCDVTRPTLRAALYDLISVALVSQQRRGQGQTNLYHLHRVPGEASGAAGGNLAFSPDGKNLSNKNVTIRSSKRQESIPKEEAVKEEADKNDSNQPAPQKTQPSRRNSATTPAPTPASPTPYSGPHSPYSAGVIFDHSSELGDSPHKAANVTQALRIWHASGLDEAAFVAHLHAARRLVRTYQGKQGSGTIANKMGYYFAVLADLSRPLPATRNPPEEGPDAPT